MPFMDEPPGAQSLRRRSGVYGAAIRALRSITNHTVNKEPKWRHTGAQLTTGYQPEPTRLRSAEQETNHMATITRHRLPARVRNAAWSR